MICTLKLPTMDNSIYIEALEEETNETIDKTEQSINEISEIELDKI